MQHTDDRPRTRAEMRARGLRHYFTGKPCSKGHIAERHYTGTCVVCQRQSNAEWIARNPGSSAARLKRYYEANRDKVKAASRRSWRKRYGLPQATRPKPESCECCQRKPTQNQMHLDHCHRTGQFRGWLCGACNRGIGLLGDTVEGLKRATAYLERLTSV